MDRGSQLDEDDEDDEEEERRTRQEEAEEEEQEEEEVINIKFNNPHLSSGKIYNNNYINKNYQKYIYLFVGLFIFIYINAKMGISKIIIFKNYNIYILF